MSKKTIVALTTLFAVLLILSVEAANAQDFDKVGRPWEVDINAIVNPGGHNFSRTSINDPTSARSTDAGVPSRGVRSNILNRDGCSNRGTSSPIMKSQTFMELFSYLFLLGR